MSNIHEILNLQAKEILELRKECKELRGDLDAANAAYEFVAEEIEKLRYEVVQAEEENKKLLTVFNVMEDKLVQDRLNEMHGD